MAEGLGHDRHVESYVDVPLWKQIYQTEIENN
jgi:hypothetical protein